LGGSGDGEERRDPPRRALRPPGSVDSAIARFKNQSIRVQRKKPAGFPAGFRA
jgi:hypothetical protein